jgi:hypothetical protein
MNTRQRNIPQIRCALFAAALLALLFFAPAQAYALKELAELTPESLRDSGFAMKVENRKDGMVAFTLTRDLSKARTFGSDSDLQVRRYASLKVSGKSGPVTECDIEPAKEKGTVIYRFAIAREWVAGSHFTLAEIEDYKDETVPHLIGGGIDYEFRLALFAGHSARH